MKLKHILVGGAVMVISYEIGKFVGEVKSMIYAINECEEVFPGITESVARHVSDSIVSSIFKSKKEP